MKLEMFDLLPFLKLVNTAVFRVSNIIINIPVVMQCKLGVNLLRYIRTFLESLSLKL